MSNHALKTYSGLLTPAKAMEFAAWIQDQFQDNPFQSPERSP